DQLKLALLTLAFFCVSGAYTGAKELKDSVLSAIVGRQFIPQAKVLFLVIMVRALFVYSRLVAALGRCNLLCFYACSYGIVGLILAVYLGHPTIGLLNTKADPSRWFGWIFYFFVEAYSPFVVGVFWSFANSVSSPEEAKKNY